MGKLETKPQPSGQTSELQPRQQGALASNYTARVTKASDLGLRGDICVHAPPAFGKSFLAATASAKWPGESLGTVPAVLDDVLWVAIDLGACDGLLASFIDVEHYIDARDIIEELGCDRGTAEIHRLVAEHTGARPEIRFVVYDTVSELDKLWQSELEISGEGDDSRWIFRKLLAKHRSFHTRSHKACGRAKPIYLCHSAALGDFNEKTPDGQRNQRKATRLPGGAEIKAAITGQGHDLYINNSTLVLSLALEERKGQLPKRIVVSGGSNFETKNRLQGLIGDREAFDLRALATRMDERIAQMRLALGQPTGGVVKGDSV